MLVLAGPLNFGLPTAGTQVLKHVGILYVMHDF